MNKRFTIIPGVGSGFLLIDLSNGYSVGWFRTTYAARKARAAIGVA